MYLCVYLLAVSFLFLEFLLLFLFFAFVLFCLFLGLLVCNFFGFSNFRIIFISFLLDLLELLFSYLLVCFNLFGCPIADKIKVFAELHESIFLEVVLVLGEVWKTFSYVGAGVNNDYIPVNAMKKRLVIVKHWHYLELKD